MTYLTIKLVPHKALSNKYFYQFPWLSPKSAICCPSLTDIFMNLPQELRIRREELGVTQEYLADLSGVGLRTIKSFESGKANPRGGTRRIYLKTHSQRFKKMIKYLITNTLRWKLLRKSMESALPPMRWFFCGWHPRLHYQTLWPQRRRHKMGRRRLCEFGPKNQRQFWSKLQIWIQLRRNWRTHKIIRPNVENWVRKIFHFADFQLLI